MHATGLPRKKQGGRIAVNLINCTQCGQVTLKVEKQPYCVSCIQKKEQEILRCMVFLRKNEQATIDELSEGTGIPIKMIRKFIEEHRLSPSLFENIYYTCRMCKKDTKDGHICERCFRMLSKSSNGGRVD